MGGGDGVMRLSYYKNEDEDMIITEDSVKQSTLRACDTEVSEFRYNHPNN
jgi:hypothetical protein